MGADAARDAYWAAFGGDAELPICSGDITGGEMSLLTLGGDVCVLLSSLREPDSCPVGRESI